MHSAKLCNTKTYLGPVGSLGLVSHLYLLVELVVHLLYAVFQLIHLDLGFLFALFILLQHIPVLDVILHPALSHLFYFFLLFLHRQPVLLYLLLQHLYQLHLSLHLLLL